MFALQFVDNNINIQFILLFVTVMVLSYIGTYRIVVGSFSQISVKTLLLKIIPLSGLIVLISGFLIY